jgi:hypothetical protein
MLDDPDGDGWVIIPPPASIVSVPLAENADTYFADADGVVFALIEIIDDPWVRIS